MRWLEGLGNVVLAPFRWLARLCAVFVSGGERFVFALLGVHQAGGRRQVEREFLPAALEIVETPPSPMGRAVAGTIMMLAVAMLAWAWIGRIDIVATAPGKIVSTGGTKLIQPFETGIIKAIHVRDGQRVKAGALLL